MPCRRDPRHDDDEEPSREREAHGHRQRTPTEASEPDPGGRPALSEVRHTCCGSDDVEAEVEQARRHRLRACAAARPSRGMRAEHVSHEPGEREVDDREGEGAAPRRRRGRERGRGALPRAKAACDRAGPRQARIQQRFFDGL